MKYTKSIDQLIDSLSLLPSIGRKSAERIAFYIINQDIKKVENLSLSIINAKTNVKHCINCGNFTEKDLCKICENPSRDKSKLCIVENIKDLIAIEDTSFFNGFYHVLGGIISPLDGIGPNNLNFKTLLKRVSENNINEIIIAINPKIEGETTINYIKEILKEKNIKISKLAYGISIGGEIEFTNSSTLAKSLENRIII